MLSLYSTMSTTICAHYLTHITYPILIDFVHQLCWSLWRLMGRTFCDLIPADLQPGAKYDQLGNILFQKKCVVCFLVILCQLCVTMIHVSLMFASCLPHLSMLTASWVYTGCAAGVLPNHSCCGTPASAASLMEDSSSSAQSSDGRETLHCGPISKNFQDKISLI